MIILKIEKINDNQIRCTLSRLDLAERKINLKELSGESDKVRTLFHDLIDQAHVDVGFEFAGEPIMIEAMPTHDSIVLIITKVNDKNGIKDKMSEFADKFLGKHPGMMSPFDDHDDLDEADFDLSDNTLMGSERLSDYFEKIKQTEEMIGRVGKEIENIFTTTLKLFIFNNLEDVIKGSRMIAPLFTSKSSLYKDSNEGDYILLLTRDEMSREDFDKVCNLMSEYSTPTLEVDGPILAYIQEHCESLLVNDAIHKLS